MRRMAWCPGLAAPDLRAWWAAAGRRLRGARSKTATRDRHHPGERFFRVLASGVGGSRAAPPLPSGARVEADRPVALGDLRAFVEWAGHPW